MTKFEVCGGLQHTTRKAYLFLKISNLLMSVSRVDTQFSFYIPNGLKNLFNVTKKVNLLFSSSDGYRHVFSMTIVAIYLPTRKGVAKHMLLLLLL